MSSQTSQALPKGRPPMPAFLMKVMNPLMKALLNSPFHGRMSDQLMVLSWTGRKSGRRYATPVGYVRQDERILVFTHSSWRKNFTTPAAVNMRIRGNNVAGTGLVVNDPAQIKEIAQILVKAYGEGMARQMGFWMDDLDRATPEEVQRSLQGIYFIEITPGNNAGSLSTREA